METIYIGSKRPLVDGLAREVER